MDSADYRDALDTASEGFIAAIARAGLDSPVAVCPGWSIRDLGAHQGKVWANATANVRAATTEHTRSEHGSAPDDDTEFLRWLAERRSDLLHTFATTDPSDPAWTFAEDDRTAGFWLRRMVHETILHRWDAQSVSGTIEPLYPEFAADGIDEYTQVGLRYSSSKPDRTYPTETLHLHCTDTEGEWMLRGEGDSTVHVTREHGKGDAAVRGPAQELVLWIWNRPANDLEIFGDEAVAQAWQALAP